MADLHKLYTLGGGNDRGEELKIGSNFDIISAASRCLQHPLATSIKPVIGRIESNEHYTTKPHSFPPASFHGGIFVHPSKSNQTATEKFYTGFQAGPKSECWNWQGTISHDGVAVFKHKGTTYYPHRMQWEIHHGPLPSGCEVTRLCSNSLCVNPGHLFMGTRSDRMSVKAQPIGIRFWAKVAKKGSNDCWEWKAGKNRKGYGKFNAGVLNGKEEQLAYRVAYILVNGPIPNGMCVCHTCDNPPCCNPKHLFLGTNDDNVADKMSKGRHRSLSGEENTNHKLAQQEVKRIRQIYLMGGYTLKDLSEEFGVSVSTISQVVNNRTWKNI